MAQCPLCDADISEDFGLIDCPGCSASLFVELDGSVRAYTNEGSEDSAPQDEAEFPVSGPQLNISAQDKSDAADFSETETVVSPPEGLDFAATPEEEVGPIEEHSVQDWEEEGLEEPGEAMEERLEEEAEFDASEGPSVHDVTNLQEDFDEVDDTADSPEATEAIEEVADPSDMSDLEDYANSEMSQAREGSLLFDITVEGIDTADLRAAVKEALTDQRFIWDLEAMLKTIKNGELKIQGVTAVKAYLIVTRIKELPVDLHWRQYAIHQP